MENHSAVARRKQNAKDIFEKITQRLEDPNGFVQITTALKSWVYEHKHRDMFRLSKDGQSVLVQHGRKWLDFMGANIRMGYFGGPSK